MHTATLNALQCVMTFGGNFTWKWNICLCFETSELKNYTQKRGEGESLSLCCNSFFGNFLHIITIFIVVGVMMSFLKIEIISEVPWLSFFLSSQLSWLSFFSGYCTHRIRLQNSEELFWAFINIQLNSFCWFGFTDVVLLHPLLFNKLAHNVFVWLFRFCCIIFSSCEKASWAAKGPKWGSRGEKGVKGWRQLVK